MADQPLTPMWVLLWATNPEIEKRPHYTQEHLTKIMSDAHEQGVKDAHMKSHREGVLDFAAEVKKRTEYWRGVLELGEPGKSVPIYDLELLLESWNIDGSSAV